MSDTVASTLLPRVYTLGFRAGQTVHHFWNTWWVEYVSTLSDHNDTAAVLWTKLQEEAPHAWQMITSFPLWYRTWWMDLVRNDPVHVFVETTLLVSVLYMFLNRTVDWSTATSKDKEDKLTRAEEDDLIEEWKQKMRKPLVDRASTTDDKRLSSAKDVPQFVVHKVEGTKMKVSMDEDPTQYPVVNFGSFDFLGMSAEYTAKKEPTIFVNDNNNSTSSSNKNTTSETGEDTEEEDKENKTSVVVQSPENMEEPEGEDASKKAKKKRKRKKKKGACSNIDNNKNSEDDATATTVFTEASSSNSNSAMKQASVDALERYGCGACGPRGFYGTVDPHLALEEEMTKFMGVEGAILYSDGASGVSSTVAAFCKRGDLLVVDEGVREPIVAGVKLSRAYVKWFKHNDMVCTSLFLFLFMLLVVMLRFLSHVNHIFFPCH